MCDSRTDTKTGLLPVNEVRSLLDVCWKAKAITELMPALPKGLKPRYVHVIDAVWHINETNGQEIGTARVSDVSAFLGVTTPSVTKLVGEMVELGLVVKHMDAADRRAVTLTLTERGLDIRRVYVEEYHAHLQPAIGRADRGTMRNHCAHIDRSPAAYAGRRAASQKHVNEWRREQRS